MSLLVQKMKRIKKCSLGKLGTEKKSMNRSMMMVFVEFNLFFGAVSYANSLLRVEKATYATKATTPVARISELIHGPL